jgi:hypothetical protein
LSIGVNQAEQHDGYVEHTLRQTGDAFETFLGWRIQNSQIAQNGEAGELVSGDRGFFHVRLARYGSQGWDQVIKDQLGSHEKGCHGVH